MDVFAVELQVAIPNQRAGQQTGFAKDLKTVADAEHKTAAAGELLDGLHHRTETRDGATAQIVAVAESTRDDDGIGVAERSFLVPDIAGGVAKYIPQHEIGRASCRERE